MREFRFYTESGIVRFCGRRANSLPSLLEGIEGVSGSSIFYHTHHALLRRHMTSTDALNDFARWAWMSFEDQELAEQLAIVDPMESVSVREVRNKLVRTIEPFIRRRSSPRKVPAAKEFFFLELQSFVLPTDLAARDLREFYQCLKEVGPGSIFFHFIEARLRLERRCSDFSRWLNDDLKESELAAQVDRLTPYAYNLRDLKTQILNLIANRLAA
jgi:hypothetical protein